MNIKLMCVGSTVPMYGKTKMWWNTQMFATSDIHGRVGWMLRWPHVGDYNLDITSSNKSNEANIKKYYY